MGFNSGFKGVTDISEIMIWHKTYAPFTTLPHNSYQYQPHSDETGDLRRQSPTRVAEL